MPPARLNVRKPISAAVPFVAPVRPLPLEPVHATLGASFGDVAGWRIPLDYGDAVAEQRAVRTASGLIDRSAQGKTRVDGADRVSFLDGVLTNDVGALAEGRGLHAATLDHKGRVHGDLVLYHGGDHLFLVTEPEATDSVLSHLNRLLVSDDASLTDVTARWCAFGLFGPRSGAIVTRVLGSPPPQEDYRTVAVEGEGLPVVVARNPYFRGDGFEMWMPPEAAERIWDAFLAEGVVPFGLRAAEALRIEAGRPKYPADMNEDTLVLEARLEASISFTKGCYVGQEVVSRATYVGQVRRLLVGLAVGGVSPPGAGAELRSADGVAGRVTSAATSATLGEVVALGYVRRDLSEPGTELTVGGDDDLRATVTALPFVR